MHREVALIQIKEPEKFFFEAQARPTTMSAFAPLFGGSGHQLPPSAVSAASCAPSAKAGHYQEGACIRGQTARLYVPSTK